MWASLQVHHWLQVQKHLNIIGKCRRRVHTSALPPTSYLQMCPSPCKSVFDFHDSSLLVSLLSLWPLDLRCLCRILFGCLPPECLCSPNFYLKLFFSLFTSSVRICKTRITILVPSLTVSSKMRHVESFTYCLVIVSAQ